MEVRVMGQSALYSKKEAEKANLTLESLRLPSWELGDVKVLQLKVGAKPVDGWFGPKSIAAWKAWAKVHQPCPVIGPGAEPGQFIIARSGYTPPAGVRVINHLEPGGVPAQSNDVSARTRPVTQFVFHLGAETHRKGDNYAQATEKILDARGLSTIMTMDIDGTIYQHFDRAHLRGRHATNHNVQSDSMDIGGPFSLKRNGEPGQKPMMFNAAIGREGDGKPPLTRGYARVKCWDLTPAQKTALALFVPWYCTLRGIPLRACDDWRTFRLSGHLNTKDPVTNVTGLVAHAQVSDPGQRVDGFRALAALREHADVTIEWRSGVDFLK